MHLSLPRRLFALLAAFAFSLPAFADQVLTTLPGGDGQAILENPKNPGETRPGHSAGGALVVDTDCAKTTMKGKTLNSGHSNPEYERCVKDKLEKAKKKGDH